MNEIIQTLRRDPYSLEHMTVELPLAITDIIEALDGPKESAEYAAAVFERMGMALGSGIFSLSNTLEEPINHIVILPQIGDNFTKAVEFVRRGIMMSLSRGRDSESTWKVNFMKPNVDLYVLAGASLCYG